MARSKSGRKTLERERSLLRRFIEVYCQDHHAPRSEFLCADCQDLWDYARTRLEKCPMDPKPKCKECAVHCYKPEYRQRIQEVMRFSGFYFVKRGRLDWLLRYFCK
jgi:transposase-like protein